MSIENRKLAAIVFTDICGFTKLMFKDEKKAMAILERQKVLLKPIINNFNGEWLKEIGDGLLISFSSAVNAVTCSLEIQRTLEHDPDLTIRIGIHIGDIIKKDGWDIKWFPWENLTFCLITVPLAFLHGFVESFAIALSISLESNRTSSMFGSYLDIGISGVKLVKE